MSQKNETIPLHGGLQRLCDDDKIARADGVLGVPTHVIRSTHPLGTKEWPHEENDGIARMGGK